MKVVCRLLGLFALFFSLAIARMAYQLPEGYETILKARSFSETFSCEGRPYGYYADIPNGCQIYHVCLPVTDVTGDLVETAHFSFLCNNGTIFDAEFLTCAHENEAFPCEAADTLFERSNAGFGIIPEEDGFEE